MLSADKTKTIQKGSFKYIAITASEVKQQKMSRQKTSTMGQISVLALNPKPP